MGIDFDILEHCKKVRADHGPPYTCPVEKCGRTYKSVCGLQYHLKSYDHDNPTPLPPATPNTPKSKKGRARASQPAKIPAAIAAAPEPLTFEEAQKMVQFDVEGQVVRWNINDILDVVPKEELPEHDKPSMEAVKPEVSAAAGPQTQLPEASFRKLESYNICDAPARPNAYIRFIEKSVEELDGEVEYDVDEEDTAWLSIMNERREGAGLSPVSVDSLELLMDRLEKESYFQASVNGHTGAVVDDDAVCCICMDGECQNTNVILFCDMCNLAVHQDCYGVPYIPEGQWLCRRCLQSPSRAVDCVLCPNQGGAFKQTDRGQWAHVVCALWIPEVRFANTVFLEPIDSIETIPAARWKLTCYVCKKRGVGACIQCHKTNCYSAFHVTCAQQAGLYMKMDTVKEGGEAQPILVQKIAYCDAHAPAESGIKVEQDVEDDALSPAEATPLSDDGQTSTSTMTATSATPAATAAPAATTKTTAAAAAATTATTANATATTPAAADPRQKMKQARKLLAKKRTSAPVILIPTIPPERIQEIGSLVNVTKKSQFVQRLIAYWTLKRQFRNGVPLLRRLQSAQGGPRDSCTGNVDTIELIRQLKYWQCLRQDLERARLLCELVRKREKIKLEMTRVAERCFHIQLRPLQASLRNVLELIAAKDTNEIFSEPVDLEEVPDYTTVVSEPMDLSTMRKKLESGLYPDLVSMEKDFDLMIANCLAYNNRDTVFYRAGIKMRDQCGAIFRQAKRELEAAGLLNETKENGQAVATGPEESLASDIDRELESLQGKNGSDIIAKLDDLMAKSQALKHGLARAKRVKLVRSELNRVKRALANADSSQSDPEAESSERKSNTLNSSPSSAGVNRRTAVLFTRKAQAALKKPVEEKDEKEPQAPPIVKKKKGRPRRNPEKEPAVGAVGAASPSATEPKAQAGADGVPDSFRVYRAGRQATDDEHSDSGTSLSTCYSRDLSEVDSDEDDSECSLSGADASGLSEQLHRRSGGGGGKSGGGGGEGGGGGDGRGGGGGGDEEEKMLQPLQLVWAKCRGYPWYPALIIDPEMPKGYVHHGVPIPSPPPEVMALRSNHTEHVYLVLFFDVKRTWQWLPAEKLEMFEPERNQSKVNEPRKPTDRKAIKRAYENALQYQGQISEATSQDEVV